MDREEKPNPRGNRPDYVLGTAAGWDAFELVRFRATEAIDELFELDILLARDRKAAPVDVTTLVDGGATLRIATETRWRELHGVIAEAELVEETSTLTLHRVALVPHLSRAALRRRCRSFVDKSLREVIASVLDNSAPGGASGRGLLELTSRPSPPPAEPSFATFSEPVGYYRWAITEPERLDDKRPFLVQYNESDLAFVARLLEAEGICFFFEHVADGAVLTLTDRPGHAPLFERDERHELMTGVGGATRHQEVVRSHRDALRVRASSVLMRDYRWRASHTPFEAREGGAGDLEHYEFPARDEDAAEPARHPARFQMERFEAERRLAQGYGTVRTLEPGYRFTLADRTGTRPDTELLVTRVETHAQQRFIDEAQLDLEAAGLRRRGGGDEPFYEVRYESLPADVRYRPARKTDKKLIFGVQTARVTAEEVNGTTELNSDKFGRVRVRFPWDQRENDGTPTSKWVRVAQYWAGPGFGALYVPRVGHEVLVAFERGDPERPIVVGRVYNEQNPPPYAEPNTTKSTIKSDSVGADGSPQDGFNELRFDDKGGEEQVFLHAQRNLDEVVLASHSTSVGGSQSNSVGGDQSNTVQGSRTHQVMGTELVKIGGNRTTVFQANEFHEVAANRVTGIGADDVCGVGGHHSLTVGAGQAITVTGDRTVGVSAAHTVTVGGFETISVGAARNVVVGAPHTITAPLHMFNTASTFSSTATDHVFTCSSFTITAGGATLKMTGGLISLDNGAGASITMAGGAIMVTSASYVGTAGGTRLLASGGATTIMAGGNINGIAPNIKLNG